MLHKKEPETLEEIQNRLLELERKWDEADATGRNTAEISKEIRGLEEARTKLIKEQNGNT